MLWNNHSGAFLIRVLFEYVSIVIALPQAGLEPLAESSIEIGYLAESQQTVVTSVFLGF